MIYPAPYHLHYPHTTRTRGTIIKTLHAYSRNEAFGMERIFPDTIIIRAEDGEWINRPLCLDRRKHLSELHGVS